MIYRRHKYHFIVEQTIKLQEYIVLLFSLSIVKLSLINIDSSSYHYLRNVIQTVPLCSNLHLADSQI